MQFLTKGHPLCDPIASLAGADIQLSSAEHAVVGCDSDLRVREMYTAGTGARQEGG